MASHPPTPRCGGAARGGRVGSESPLHGRIERRGEGFARTGSVVREQQRQFGRLGVARLYRFAGQRGVDRLEPSRELLIYWGVVMPFHRMPF
jgi:hypothetical protein